MNKLLGLTGYARVGKNTIANILVEKYGFTELAFANNIRQAVYNLNPLLFDNIRVLDSIKLRGYEKTKDLFPEFRRLLQCMGTEVARNLFGDDIWRKTTFRLADKLDTDVVISDVRLTPEVKDINSKGGFVVQITRPDIFPANDHETEKGVDPNYCTYILNLPKKSESPIENLYPVIKTMMEELYGR